MYRWIQQIFRWLLIIAAMVGGAMNYRLVVQVPPLEADYKRLYNLVGDMPIADDKKIWVMQLPSDEPYAWKWRVFVPAKFAYSTFYSSGLVGADSPRNHTGSYGSGSGFAKDESIEFTATVGLFKNREGTWQLHTQRQNGRGRSGVSRELAELLDSGDHVIVETAGLSGGEPVAFDSDDWICLLRVRGEKEAKKMPDGVSLYPGLYFYLTSRDDQQKFEKSMRGKP